MISFFTKVKINFDLKGMFGVVGSSVEESAEFYNRWNEEVKKVVPADRLLVITKNKIIKICFKSMIINTEI